jgi:hypothetical protein
MKGCASGGDRLADAGGLVRGAIVEHHDHRARAPAPGLLDVGAKR